MRILAGIILPALWYWDHYVAPILEEIRGALDDIIGAPIDKYDFEK